MNKKLSLNKEVIAQLNDNSMHRIEGGNASDTCVTCTTHSKIGGVMENEAFTCGCTVVGQSVCVCLGGEQQLDDIQ